MGLFKSDPPPPPDYTPIANASKEAAELAYKTSQEQLAWAKEQYAKDSELTGKVVDKFLQTQDEVNANARTDRERYEQTFQPLEDKLAQDAASYSSPERKALEMGRATAGVAQQFEAARDSATRNLESFGINPGSTRYAAMDIGTRAQQAAAQAAAANQASQQVDATGRALRSEAINVGRGYPGQIAQSYGLGLNAGAGAVNSNLATTASGASTMGTGTQWAGVGNSALGTWSNALTSGYNAQMQNYNAEQQGSGLGAILGLAGGALLGSKKPWIFAAEGGAIPAPGEANPGAAVPTAASPTGGKAIDDVPARLTPGEFVVPKDVASWKGEEFFQKMIEQSRKAKQGATAKPEMKSAIPQPPTFQSGAPQLGAPQSAIPMAGAA